MRAMILAAGRGNRMRPLTDVTPKPLLKVHGKPLIEYHIEKLVQAGFDEIVINHAWLGEQIEGVLGEGKRFNARLYYSAEHHALETAGGIINAMGLLCPTPQHQQFVVVNGDIFTDYDFSKLPSLSSQLAHLVLVPNPAHNQAGDFSLNNGQVSREGRRSHTFSGMAVYQRQFFAGGEAVKAPLGPRLFAAAEAGQLTGEVHRGNWCDVGTPARLEWLNKQER